MDPLGTARRTYDTSKERAAAVVSGRRKRWPPFDHVAAAYERYKELRGDRLAAGIAYYAFLSLFPIIALAFAVAGYVVSAYPDAGADVSQAIDDVLPGMAQQLPIDKIANAKTGTGLVGLAALLWSGTGWVGALREGMRTLDAAPFGAAFDEPDGTGASDGEADRRDVIERVTDERVTDERVADERVADERVADDAGAPDGEADERGSGHADPPEDPAAQPGTGKLGFIPGKLRDIVALILLGLTLLVSVGLSGFATTATPGLLASIGLAGVSWGEMLLRAVSLGIALLTDMVMFLIMFTRLADIRVSRRHLLFGAFFGGIGLEVLKLAGTWVIARSTSNPVYASFAVTVGLLLWINLSSRVILFAATWTSVYRVVVSFSQLS